MPGLVPVAIVSNSLPPYRIHLHRRIAREIAQIQLWSLQTHPASSDARWANLEPPAEIRPVLLAAEQHDTGARRGLLGRVLAEWKQGRRIIAWLEAHAVRAVVIVGYNDVARWRVVRWCHRHGVACFLSGDSNAYSDFARGPKLLAKKIYLGGVQRRCAAILPFGSLGRQFFARYGGASKAMFYFPLEPDYAVIEALTEAHVDQARRRFALDPARRRIVFSGRLIGLKRLDLLMRAFASIAAARPRWDLLMVGDGPLRGELQALLPAELRPRVTWAGHVEDAALLGALYRASDVLVLCSEYEAWGLVVNEAAAAGLALVCSSVVGATPELVRDGVNGRIFPTGDAGALAECLLDVTADGRIDSMKAASGQILRAWRRQGDPVRGLLDALRFTGVLGKSIDD